VRHIKSRKKLNVTSSHQKAMMKNMADALFRYEKINTTLKRAKILSGYAEKLITISKREDLHSRRLVARHIRDKSLLKKIFDTYSARYQSVKGGYTRIVRIQPRKGDGAPMASISLIQTTVEKAETTEKTAKSKK
jgi:large subunit ribosomal protein L17